MADQEYSIESLMALISELNGWMSQSAVSFTVHQKGFHVATTICGRPDIKPEAHGSTMPKALLALAKRIAELLEEQKRFYTSAWERAMTKIQAFELPS